MTEAPRGDYQLLIYYAAGIVLGYLVLYFLPRNEAELERLKSKNTATSAELQAEREAVGKMKSELKKEASAWDGDNIPEEELERIRKRFRLTHEQMAEVMNVSKEEATLNQTSYLTPHQRMNRTVYLIMILVLIYILNRDYGNLVLIWLVRMFPKEAQVLGLL